MGSLFHRDGREEPGHTLRVSESAPTSPDPDVPAVGKHSLDAHR